MEKSPWRAHHIGTILNKFSSFILITSNKDDYLYVLSEFRCYVFGLDSLYSRENVNGQIYIKAIYQFQELCIEILKLNNDILIVTCCGIYAIPRLENNVSIENGDGIVVTAITSDFEIYRVQNIISASVWKFGFILCTISNNVLSVSKLLLKSAKILLTIDTVVINDLEIRQVGSRKKYESSVVLTVLKCCPNDEIIEGNISQKLFTSLAKQFNSFVDEIILIGCPDGRLLAWLTSKTEKNASDNHQTKLSKLFNLYQPIIGIFSTLLKDSKKCCIFVIGKSGTILSINIEDIHSNQSLLPEFRRPTEFYLNFMEHHVASPVNACHINDGTMVFCSGKNGNVFYVPIESDLSKLSRKAINLPMNCVKNVFLFKSNRFSMDNELNLMALNCNGKLYHAIIPTDFSDHYKPTSFRNFKWPDLKDSLEILHENSHKIQSLLKERGQVNKSIVELSTLFDLLNVNEADELFCASINLDDVLGHNSEKYVKVQIKNNSLHILKASSWIFTITISNDHCNSSMSYNFPLLHDFKPKKLHELSFIINLNEVNVNCPLTMELGLNFVHLEFYSLKISKLEVSLIDLFKISDPNENNKTVHEEIINMSSSRLGFSMFKDIKSFNQAYVIEFCICGHSLEKILSKDNPGTKVSTLRVLQSILSDSSKVTLKLSKKAVKLSVQHSEFIRVKVESKWLPLVLEFVANVQKIFQRNSERFDYTINISRSALSHLQNLKSELNLMSMDRNFDLIDALNALCYIRSNVNSIFIIK